MSRPPIVVVVGHIDHGKTTLLDTIRKTKVAEKESGGITQHIGAYEIEHHGKKITFIDTPGHEAFSKMRSRGTAAADIGILVVAGDESVKPQTKEAIKILLEADIPYCIAINKMDKPGADGNRVKQDLAQENVLTESWGGKVPVVEISAKKGENIDELLELILLMAEVEELSAEEGNAKGIVVESHCDSSRGNTATLLILNGKLKKGDFLVVGNSIENIKILENFLGKAISEAHYSMPIRVSGLSALSEVGEEFKSFQTRKDAKNYATQHKNEEKQKKHQDIISKEDKIPTLFLVLKSDVSGSREAIEGMLEKLSARIGFVSTASLSEAVETNEKIPEARLVLLKSEVGDVNENDIKSASISKRVVIAAFKVRVAPAQKELAERHGIKILQSEIIYDLFDAIKEELSRIIPPEIKRTDSGRAKILATFKRDGSRQIIGGKVVTGRISKGVCEIERNKEVLCRAKIRDLQHMKKSVDEVKEGMEFGVMVECDTEIKKDDALVIFTEEAIYKKL